MSRPKRSVNVDEQQSDRKDPSDPPLPRLPPLRALPRVAANDSSSLPGLSRLPLRLLPLPPLHLLPPLLPPLLELLPRPLLLLLVLLLLQAAGPLEGKPRLPLPSPPRQLPHLPSLASRPAVGEKGRLPRRPQVVLPPLPRHLPRRPADTGPLLEGNMQ